MTKQSQVIGRLLLEDSQRHQLFFNLPNIPLIMDATSSGS